MKTLALFVSFLAVANAVPVLSDDAGAQNSTHLEKRDTEILYLTNCAAYFDYSNMVYYPTSAQGNAGQNPDNNNFCWTSTGSYTTWEGTAVSCKFPTGVTFTSHIDSGAQARNNYAYAGWGNNGRNWNCYKDTKRVVYGACSSIYYCLPV